MNKRTQMLEFGEMVSTLLKLSIPAMIGMLVNAMYNIVDTIFIGRGVGSMGIAGLSIAFPLQSIIMAIGLLYGIGGASIISRSLGAKDYEKAQNTFGNVISMGLITSVCLSLFGEIFLDEILMLFGASETILPYAREYMQIIMAAALIKVFLMSMNNVIRSEGSAKVAMNCMLISALINIALDPLFIFVFDMGIRGAAVATVISQGMSALYQLWYFYSGKSILKFSLKSFKPKWSILKEIYVLGAASFARNAATSVITALINNLLGYYGGDVSIAVYGVINKLLMFTAMPIIGFSQGMQPVLGYNYGAKLMKRAKQSVMYSTLFSTLVGTFLFVIIMLWPAEIMGIFTTDQMLISRGVDATRIIFLTLPIIGLQIIGAGLFQAIGKALPAMILTLSRQILFLIPLLYLLSSLLGLNGIWYAFLSADILSTVITAILVLREFKRFDKLVECMCE